MARSSSSSKRRTLCSPSWCRRRGTSFHHASCPRPRSHFSLFGSCRYRDFVNGVPSYTLPNVARDYSSDPLSPAERIRFTHTHVVTSPTDDGLGIAPGVAEWSRVESIMALHDRDFNEHWIKSWTSKKLGVGFSDDDLDGIKNQVGRKGYQCEDGHR